MEKRTLGCICARGQEPWCHVCTVAVAIQMRGDHPDTLSISMLQRRMPKLEGYVAAILLEATLRMPNRRNGGYVTHSPAHS